MLRRNGVIHLSWDTIMAGRRCELIGALTQSVSHLFIYFNSLQGLKGIEHKKKKNIYVQGSISDVLKWKFFCNLFFVIMFIWFSQ